MSIDDLLICVLILTGLLGILTNSATLILMLSKEEIRSKDYIAFVASRSTAHVAFFLHSLVFQPLAIRYLDTYPILSTVAAGICNSLSDIIVFSEVLLAWNRYSSVCRSKSHSKVFRKSHIFVMCASVWLLGPLVNMGKALRNGFGRRPGMYCWVSLSKDISGITDLLVLMCYGIVAFFYYKVYRTLKTHGTQMAVNGIASNAVHDTRALMGYIRGTVVFPVIGLGPLLVVTFGYPFLPSSSTEIAMFVATCVVLTCMIFDPVLTLLMIKPVRAAVRRMFKGSHVTPTTVFVVQQHVQRTQVTATSGDRNGRLRNQQQAAHA